MRNVYKYTSLECPFVQDQSHSIPDSIHNRSGNKKPVTWDLWGRIGVETHRSGKKTRALGPVGQEGCSNPQVWEKRPVTWDLWCRKGGGIVTS